MHVGDTRRDTRSARLRNAHSRKTPIAEQCVCAVPLSAPYPLFACGVVYSTCCMLVRPLAGGRHAGGGGGGHGACTCRGQQSGDSGPMVAMAAAKTHASGHPGSACVAAWSTYPQRDWARQTAAWDGGGRRGQWSAPVRFGAAGIGTRRAQPSKTDTEMHTGAQPSRASSVYD